MKSWAVIVGINDYPPRAGQPPLNGAVADAADFADWALDPQGGAVEPANLYFWTHPRPANRTARLAAYLRHPTPWWDPDTEDGLAPPDFNQPPDFDRIVETALAAGAAARADAQDDEAEEVHRIYIFFAGHGLQTNTLGAALEIQTCFVAGDFRPDARAVKGLIPCEDLRRALLSGGFDEVFMFLDCCRVAMSKLNMAAPSLGSPNTRSPPQPVHCVGNAAQKNKIAFETDSPPPRGAFSRTLIEGLRTVRDPATQQLTVESLRAYVSKNIATHTTKEQHPNIIADPDMPSPVVLTGPPLPTPQIVAPIRITFASLPPGSRVQLVDSKGAAVGDPIAAQPEPVTLDVPADTYYSIDVLGTTVSQAFKHQGPEITDVSL